MKKSSEVAEKLARLTPIPILNALGLIDWQATAPLINIFRDQIASAIREQVKEALEEAAKVVKRAHYDYCGQSDRFPCEELAEFQVGAIRKPIEGVE